MELGKPCAGKPPARFDEGSEAKAAAPAKSLPPPSLLAYSTRRFSTLTLNREPSNPRLPWTSLVLLAALLCLAPYAMRFGPFERAVPYAADPYYFQRVALVLFGLFATVAAFAEFAITLARHRSTPTAVIPSAAVAFACFVVGWRSFPYWALGVYQVGIGAFPARDQDPKNLIPMIWIGELWRLPILLFQLASYVLIPCLLVAAGFALWRRRFSSAIVTFGGASISAAFLFCFSADYITWLLD